jgi:hypothetical protein
VVVFPSVMMAQSSIAGQVRDESGGVLPGVTVEAASPVLIEKAKSVVTDDQGRYQIIDLRQGTYKVTFTLTGFSTIVRDGIELPANFTATVSADMKSARSKKRLLFLVRHLWSMCRRRRARR